MYFIYYGSKKLSGFYPNDIRGVFSFRKNDCYSFQTIQEAQDFINYINLSVNKPENKERYGNMQNKHISTAKSLKIN